MALAVYACHPEQTRGRRINEALPQGRTDYQRDRDRIVHCSAFRRLEYKTQVFLNHEGDLFRTRLTHSIEVAQIARTLARNLQVNEDLIEAIALAHDLGHTPFGHAGQDELNACMREYYPESGGFEHNLQSLRIVDELEERYASFNGLNLCFETREGILKHCSKRNARELGDVAARFLNNTQPSLEAQLTNLADEIAYNNHDVDDGLRSGLITVEQLQQVEIFAEHFNVAKAKFPQAETKRLVAETIRAMINTLVLDLTNNTRANIAELQPQSLADIQNGPRLAAFSAAVFQQAQDLKQFLRHNLYRHTQVLRMTLKAQKIVRELFRAFANDPRLLADEYQRDDELAQARAIADYIAGMTDRYAIQEHKSIYFM